MTIDRKAPGSAPAQRLPRDLDALSRSRGTGQFPMTQTEYEKLEAQHRLRDLTLDALTEEQLRQARVQAEDLEQWLSANAAPLRGPCECP
jgi:hypothetical protein